MKPAAGRAHDGPYSLRVRDFIRNHAHLIRLFIHSVACTEREVKGKISANVLLREVGMDKLTGYILLTLYVGAILVVWRIGAACLGEFSGLAFGISAFMLSGGYMAARQEKDPIFGQSVMLMGVMAALIGLAAPLFA